MKGSIVAAGEGDKGAAGRAHDIGELLIREHRRRHGAPLGAGLARPRGPG
jgi:hypothetical protein